jgi:hypothetical protein
VGVRGAFPLFIRCSGAAHLVRTAAKAKRIFAIRVDSAVTHNMRSHRTPGGSNVSV